MVVVDEGSTDATADFVDERRRRHGGIVLISQEHRGKGAPVPAAVAQVDGDIAVQVADREYDPADVPAMIEPIEFAWPDTRRA